MSPIRMVGISQSECKQKYVYAVLYADSRFLLP